jgi:septum formation protein
MELILASQSKYRIELLSRVYQDFTCISPKINEDEFKNQGFSPLRLAEKLAFEKAYSLKKADSVVIGSDQVCSLGEKIFSKPGNRKKAIETLTFIQGTTHNLYTSVCIMTYETSICWTNIAKLSMRKLTVLDIENYLDLDEPYDCAGSYKLERAGISLFEKIECDDFTAIQGLPLLQLCQELSKLGFRIPSKTQEN